MVLSGMEENKKSGGGDVRAKAPSWDIEREKAKNVFFGFFPLSPTVARMRATHIPRRPKKKPLRGKKVGFAEKKTAPMACRTESCVVTPERWGTAVAKQLPKNDALLQLIRCLIVECGGL